MKTDRVYNSKQYILLILLMKGAIRMFYKKFSFIIMLIFVTSFMNISTFAEDVKININGKEIYTSQSPVIDW